MKFDYALLVVLSIIFLTATWFTLDGGSETGFHYAVIVGIAILSLQIRMEGNR